MDIGVETGAGAVRHGFVGEVFRFEADQLALAHLQQIVGLDAPVLVASELVELMLPDQPFHVDRRQRLGEGPAIAPVEIPVRLLQGVFLSAGPRQGHLQHPPVLLRVELGIGEFAHRLFEGLQFIGYFECSRHDDILPILSRPLTNGRGSIGHGVLTIQTKGAKGRRVVDGKEHRRLAAGPVGVGMGRPGGNHEAVPLPPFQCSVSDLGPSGAAYDEIDLARGVAVRGAFEAGRQALDPAAKRRKTGPPVFGWRYSSAQPSWGEASFAVISPSPASIRFQG